MTSELFLKPRLTGKRFEGGVIPLEMLRDFSVLEEMIFDVAKWRYRQANPDRARSPRGFTDDVLLVLSAVEDGSAKPVINLVLAAGMLFSDSQTYLADARDSIINAIATVSTGKALPETFIPKKALRYFDRFGRGLRDGEAIEFSIPGSVGVAVLTKDVRRKLVHAAGLEAITEEVILYGAIPEADQERLSFTLQLPDGRRLPSIIPQPHLETVIDAFNGYSSKMKVCVRGIGKFNTSGPSIQSLESVEHISVLDPLDALARLDELRFMKDGWLDGEGARPATECIDLLARGFDAFFPNDLPAAHIYPTPGGGLRCEWTIGSQEISFEVHPGDSDAKWHSLNLKTDLETEMTFDLLDAASWGLIVKELRHAQGLFK